MTCNAALANQLHSTVVLVGFPVEAVPVLEAAGAEAVCTEMEAGATPARREKEWKEGRQEMRKEMSERGRGREGGREGRGGSL